MYLQHLIQSLPNNVDCKALFKAFHSLINGLHNNEVVKFIFQNVLYSSGLNSSNIRCFEHDFDIHVHRICSMCCAEAKTMIINNGWKNVNERSCYGTSD